jgi:hypothetical protein
MRASPDPRMKARIADFGYTVAKCAEPPEIHSRCFPAPIHLRQCGHRCGGDRIMRLAMA